MEETSQDFENDITAWKCMLI